MIVIIRCGQDKNQYGSDDGDEDGTYDAADDDDDEDGNDCVV